MSAARTGILLAGGRSSRMGTPKALVDLDGSPLATHVARPLAAVCDEIVLSVSCEAEAPQSLVEEIVSAVRNAGAARPSIVRDHEPHLGPVAGLAAALSAASGGVAFATGCDSPLLSDRLVRGLFDLAESDATLDVVLPRRKGRLEPLLAVYRVARMAPHFRARLEAGGGRPTDGWNERHVLFVEGERLRQIDPAADSFRNVNTPAELDRMREELRRRADRRARSRPESNEGA